MANNLYHKEYEIDRFARNWYCQHARLNQLRADKFFGKRKVRRNSKKSCMKEYDEFLEGEFHE